MILVVASVQENATGKDEHADEQQKQHLHAFSAPVHEITVEYVGVLGRWKTVLAVYKKN